MIERAMQVPSVLQQRKATLSTLLHGGAGVIGVIDSCVPPNEVKMLPVDLTALAVCFASRMSAIGIAVVPAIAVLDPASQVPVWHEAEVGFASPVGGVLIEDFYMRVRRPGGLQETVLAFWLIATPAF